MSPIASLMPEVQPAPGMRKRLLTTVFVMAAVLARMLARIWSASGALVVKAQEFAPLASPGAVHYVTFVVVYRRHFEKFFYTEKER